MLYSTSGLGFCIASNHCSKRYLFARTFLFLWMLVNWLFLLVALHFSPVFSLKKGYWDSRGISSIKPWGKAMFWISSKGAGWYLTAFVFFPQIQVVLMQYFPLHLETTNTDREEKQKLTEDSSGIMMCFTCY